MATTTDQPADTRTMKIVHDAHRRDLRRAITVLSTDPAPNTRRRRALADHITWMMTSLHRHHHGEDEGLWPLIRERNPTAAALLDDMRNDHVRIEPAITATEHAAAAYHHSSAPSVRDALRNDLEGLCAVLLPHLAREEAEAMPTVTRSITQTEWDKWDHQYFIDTKTTIELGREAHWLLDDLDPELHDHLTHVVPPIQRFILLHGFGPQYRRRARLLWGSTAPAPSRDR